MGDLQGNHQNYDSGEEIVPDSEDELDINDEDNAMVINLNDNRIVNPPVVADHDIPDYVPIDHNLVDVNNDSDRESMNGSNHSNSTNEEMIIDSENDENNSEEEIISDNDDQDDHIPAESDVDDDSDDENLFNNPIQETFSLNAEAEGFIEPLVAAGNLQAVEQFILIVAKTLRFKESYKSMITSFKMANLGFNNAHFPNNMRNFWRIVNRRQVDFTNITVCTICWELLGHSKRPQLDCRCGKCGPNRKNSELGTYLYINLRNQIGGLLHKRGMHRDLEYPYTRIKQNIDAIEDVYDGSEYRRLSARGEFLWRENHNYSLAIWTDGVSPVKSANVTIWPVFVQVLELSPRARQRNSMLAAVYVGPRKPQMSQFLTPVTMELRNLSQNGINWRPDDNEEIITSRFMTLIVSCDSEGRYDIFGMTRHNGDFGCTFCEANGERIGHHTIYRKNDGNAADRNDAQIRRDANLAHETNQRQRGVRVISAMSIVPHFDLRTGQLVEAMHCLWEGNFLRLYNNLINPQTANHILPRDIATISERITSIRTPTKLSRLPRDLARLANFTATEYRNNAWYYWLPCAQDFLDPNYLRLCAIFAEATFILNKDSIFPHELDRAEELLDEYRRSFENYFPEEQLVYNVHLLKHIVRSVRELGPLWVASGFWFESLNRQVVNYLTSPTDRAWQVACRMLLGQMVEKFMDRPLSPAVENLLRELIGKEKWEEPPDIATGTSIHTNGVGIPRLLRAEEIVALREAGFVHINVEDLIVPHTKMTKDGVKYQSLDAEENARVTKYNDSIAYVNSQYRAEPVEFVTINSIITWQHEDEQLQGIVGTRFRVIRPAFDTTYMKIVEQTQDVIYVPLSNVITPGVLVQSCGRTYISRLPNRWDND